MLFLGSNILRDKCTDEKLHGYCSSATQRMFPVSFHMLSYVLSCFFSLGFLQAPMVSYGIPEDTNSETEASQTEAIPNP